MNKKLLALYGLKWNPFSPELPTEALTVTPRVEHFYWRIEQNLIQEGGFALVTGDPGTGKTTLVGDLIESLADENVTVGNLVEFRAQPFTAVNPQVDGRPHYFDAVLTLAGGYTAGEEWTVVIDGTRLHQCGGTYYQAAGSRYAATAKDTTGVAVPGRKETRATCESCHGLAHEVAAAESLESLVSPVHQIKTCGACHESYQQPRN